MLLAAGSADWLPLVGDEIVSSAVLGLAAGPAGEASLTPGPLFCAEVRWGVSSQECPETCHQLAALLPPWPFGLKDPE